MPSRNTHLGIVVGVDHSAAAAAAVEWAARNAELRRIPLTRTRDFTESHFMAGQLVTARIGAMAEGARTPIARGRGEDRRKDLPAPRSHRDPLAGHVVIGCPNDG